MIALIAVVAAIAAQVVIGGVVWYRNGRPATGILRRQK